MHIPTILLCALLGVSGGCEEGADPCEAGTVETRACGFNSRGEESRECVDTSWGDWGTCDDPDACEDGSEQEESCGNGTRSRTCSSGQYADWSSCSDPGANFVAVCESEECALRADGQILVFPDQLIGEDIEKLSSGSLDVCGLGSTGAVSCWRLDTSTPQPLPSPSENFTEVRAYWYDVSNPSDSVVGCGLLASDSTIACWDHTGATITTGEWAPPSGTFKHVSVGCGVRTDGSLDCWAGEGNEGFPTVGTFSEVETNGDPSCALATNGTVECWRFGASHPAPQGTFTALGWNSGLTGAGTISRWSLDGIENGMPVPGTYTSIAGRCGVTPGGTIACWGGFGEACNQPLEQAVEGLEPANICGKCDVTVSFGEGEECACGGTFACDQGAEGYACKEGNETLETASALPATDDSVDDWQTVDSTLDVYDIDWFKVEVDDTFGGILEPEFRLVLPVGHVAELCGEYRDGTTAGDSACVTVTGGEPTILALDPDLGVGDGFAAMQIVYIGGADTCASYELSYRF